MNRFLGPTFNPIPKCPFLPSCNYHSLYCLTAQEFDSYLFLLFFPYESFFVDPLTQMHDPLRSLGVLRHIFWVFDVCLFYRAVALLLYCIRFINTISHRTKHLTHNRASHCFPSNSQPGVVTEVLVCGSTDSACTNSNQPFAGLSVVLLPPREESWRRSGWSTKKCSKSCFISDKNTFVSLFEQK